MMKIRNWKVDKISAAWNEIFLWLPFNSDHYYFVKDILKGIWKTETIAFIKLVSYIKWFILEN